MYSLFIVTLFFQKKGISSVVSLIELGAINGSYLLRGPIDDPSDIKFTDSNIISKNTSITLNEGDFVRFGINREIYQLCKAPLNVASSMITDNASILKSLLTLGGTFSKSWVCSCTHLIMENLTISPKVGLTWWNLLY